MNISTHPFASVCRAALLSAVLLTLLAGCAAHHEYRTTLGISDSTNTANYQFCTLERQTNYLLGFVEIDDQGWLWDGRPHTNQMQTVLDAIRAESANGRGLIISTFVHGWKHNADYNDDYVKLLRRSLNRLSKLENTYAETHGVTPRKVVGVYVGWRGLSQRLPFLRETTFWGRKDAAHEVGRGALAELFLRLEAIVNDTKLKAKEYREHHPEDPHSTNGPVASRLMIVGHSFGGAATYSALAPLILERIITTEHTPVTNAPMHGFADMVVLVNPAFEAARFQVLLDAVRRNPPTERVKTWPLNLAVFTSEADGATKTAFPFGRTIGTLFQRHQSREELRANRTAVGHYTPFMTHTLTLTNTSTHKPPRATNAPINTVAQELDPGSKQKNVRQNSGYENIQANQKTLKENAPKMKTSEARSEALRENLYLGKTVLKPTANNTNPQPFIIARVSRKIIPNHNTIDRDTFMHALSEFLLTLAPDERIQDPGTPGK
ncbi:MAG: hypothetical protein QOF48_2806 [Verrucomicrobiota bacterium]|jgi:hypothetical protein